MVLPVLNIPSQDLSRRPKPYLQPKKLKRWIYELPTANTRETAHLFLVQLNTLNKSNYPLTLRIQLMEPLRPVARQLLILLKQAHKQARIPLAPRNLIIHETIQQILEAMASGYKIIVSELLLNERRKEHDELLLREAIYISIQYLSRRLLEAYLVYSAEPEHVWRELHHLYRYAEQHSLHSLAIDDPHPDFSLPDPYTIDLVYKRILLLSLAEPYHLMWLEAEDIYYLISAWTNACHILPMANAPAEGEYAVDMNSDSPPRFISHEVDWTATDGRLIDVAEVKKRLDRHLQGMLRTNLAMLDEDANILILRKQRDMLLRLDDAWHGALKRKFPRQDSATQIRMAAGLNACHFYLSQRSDFTPETDELKLKSEFQQSESAVSATAYQAALQKDYFHINNDYPVNPWRQNNTSHAGSALACTADCRNMDIKVGDVVAYCDDNHNNTHWKIGVIRWLKSRNDQGMDLGIMNFASSAVPVAVKALAGPGTGTDYFRSLLIPKQVSIQQTRSMIVPTAIYDIGSVLSVNMKQRIVYIKLSQLQLATSLFSQFEFEVLESSPANERALL